MLQENVFSEATALETMHFFFLCGYEELREKVSAWPPQEASKRG